jgi:hypothetical protein
VAAGGDGRRRYNDNSRGKRRGVDDTSVRELKGWHGRQMRRWWLESVSVAAPLLQEEDDEGVGPANRRKG